MCRSWRELTLALTWGPIGRCEIDRAMNAQTRERPCAGFNQPVLLELPLLEPPLSSKFNCVEWGALKGHFDADFRRL